MMGQFDITRKLLVDHCSVVECVLPILFLCLILAGLFLGINPMVLVSLLGLLTIAIIGGGVFFLRPWWGIYLMAVLIPLELFQVIPGVNITVSKLMGGLLFGMIVIHFWSKGIRGFFRTPVDVPIAFFFVACLLSLLQASVFSKAFQALFSFASYLVIFYLCVNYLDTKKKVLFSVWCFWASLFFVSAFSIIQGYGYLTGTVASSTLMYIGDRLVSRQGGTTLNSALFSVFPLLGFGLNLGMLRLNTRFWVKGLLFVSLVVFALSVYNSYTRSALLALVPMGLLYGALFAKRKVVFQLFLVVAVLFVFGSLPGYFLDHFSRGIRLEDPSTSSRMMQLIAAKELLLDHWFLGTGLHQSDLMVVGRQLGFDLVDNRVHCTPVVLFLELGLLGLVGFLAMILSFALSSLKSFFQTRDPELQAVCAAGVIIITGHFFHLLFHPAYFMSIIGITYGIAMAGVCLVRRQALKQEE